MARLCVRGPSGQLSTGPVCQVELALWDTAGQERFHAITSTYYRGADAILLMYSLENETSFQRIPDWLDDAVKFCNDDIVIALLGNKCDLPEDQHTVKTEDAQQYADFNNMALYLVSAKEGTNCKDALTAILRSVMEKRHAREEELRRKQNLVRR